MKVASQIQTHNKYSSAGRNLAIYHSNSSGFLPLLLASAEQIVSLLIEGFNLVEELIFRALLLPVPPNLFRS